MPRSDAIPLATQYEMMIDLYKFYFERLVDTNVYALGIVGAVLSFYLANRKRRSASLAALALPSLIAVGMALMCGVSAYGIFQFHGELKKLAAELSVRRAPNTLVLIVGFVTFSVIHLAVAIAVVRQLLVDLCWMKRHRRDDTGKSGQSTRTDVSLMQEKHEH